MATTTAPTLTVEDIEDAFHLAGVPTDQVRVDLRLGMVRHAIGAPDIPCHAANAALCLLGATNVRWINYPSCEFPFSLAVGTGIPGVQDGTLRVETALCEDAQ
jgi:hypothetical protein